MGFGLRRGDVEIAHEGNGSADGGRRRKIEIGRDDRRFEDIAQNLCARDILGGLEEGADGTQPV